MDYEAQKGSAQDIRGTKKITTVKTTPEVRATEHESYWSPLCSRLVLGTLYDKVSEVPSSGARFLGLKTSSGNQHLFPV